MDQISQRLMMGAAGKRGFDPNTPIGTFIEGGYFAGVISQGGSKWAIIVAPKAGGQSGGTYGTFPSTNIPNGARTLNNGPSATAALTGTYASPAATFCNNLTLNGFTDWYLPSRDELELCYRNLKPTTTNNSTTNRVRARIRSTSFPPGPLINYSEGNDQDADTQGVNRNSDPTGAAYTTSNPARTSLSAFRDNGAEAFATNTWYWSSTSAGTRILVGNTEGGEAWRQSFSNGVQDCVLVNASYLARAVRRVKI